MLQEKYEADKDIVYFPVDTAPTYQSAKRAKAATDDRNYKADYEEMKKSNQLNLCETPVYKTQQEHKAKVSNAAYTKNYEETKASFRIFLSNHYRTQNRTFCVGYQWPIYLAPF